MCFVCDPGHRKVFNLSNCVLVILLIKCMLPEIRREIKKSDCILSAYRSFPMCTIFSCSYALSGRSYPHLIILSDRMGLIDLSVLYPAYAVVSVDFSIVVSSAISSATISSSLISISWTSTSSFARSVSRLFTNFSISKASLLS